MLTNEEKPEQKDWAAAVKVLYPDQDGNGAHVNISGISLIKNAPNADNAKTFIEFLASDEGQALYAARVFEFPVKASIEASDVVKSFTPEGTKIDDLSLNEIASQRKLASELVDQVGYNN